MLSERTIEILENNDMTVFDRHEQNGEFTREIEFYSPEGEDVCECIFYDGTDESFIKAFRSNAENFDTDEHAAMWINNRGSVNGVPENVRDLITDAEWIKDTLLTIADELEAEENTENLSCMNRRQFYNYILENFDISGEAGRLINNILCYVESQGMEENEQYRTLCSLLDGTIGLTDNELKRVCL